MLRSVLVEGGIDTRRRGVHALRHQFAIGVLRESKNLVVVQKLLGHSNIATTSRYVDHLELGELRDALPQAGPSADPPSAPQDGLTSAEVSVMLGVGMWNVADLWRSGHLEGRKVGGVLRLDPDSVEALRAERAGTDHSQGWNSRGHT
jgi:hypothetical protein